MGPKKKAAAGSQKPAPRQGGSSQPPNKPATKPTAKSSAKEKGTCPRCYENMNPGWTTDHDISKCLKDARYNDMVRHTRMWEKHAAKVGDAEDKVADKGKARQVLHRLVTKEKQFAGKPVTKTLLEFAFLALYSDLVNEVPEDQTNEPAPTGSGPAQSSASEPNKDNKDKTPAKTREQFTTKLDDQRQPAPKRNEPKYPMAVLQNANLDKQFVLSSEPVRRQFPGEDVLIATNYIAVSKVPSGLHMYSITFGTTERVRTEKEVDDDAKAVAAQGEQDEEGTLSETMAETSIDDGEPNNDDSNRDDDVANTSGSTSRRKVSQRSEKARIFKALARRNEFSGIQWATDYTLMWSLQPLQLACSGDCVITDIDYLKLSGRMHNLDTVTFTPRDRIVIGDSSSNAAKSLLNAVATNDPAISLKKEAGMRITALNAFVSKVVTSNANLISVGPNKFFVKDDWPSTGKMLNIRRGYFTSIRPGSSSVLLNVNVATSVFWNSIPASDVFRYSNSHREAKAHLKGLTVYIRYLRKEHDGDYDPNLEKHRHRTVAAFGDVPGRETFEQDNGDTITVQEYFRQMGYEIKQLHLPCISVNIAPPKPRSNDSDDDQKDQKDKSSGVKKHDQPPQKIHWIPPELLSIAAYQPYGQLLPPELTYDMIKAAVRPPATTQHMIVQEGLGLLGLKTDPSPFQPLQLEIGNRLIEIPGYVMSPPTIRYANNKLLAVQNASWNLKDVKFFSAPNPTGIRYPLREAVCTIDFRSTPEHSGLANIGQKLSQHLVRHGLAFANEAHKRDLYFDLGTERANLVTNQRDEDINIHDILKGYLAQHPEIRLAVVILSRKRPEEYGRIKRVCDQWLGLHTVCLVEEKHVFFKKDRFGEQQKIEKVVDLAQLSNIALKVNMKLRGQNHQVIRHNSQDPSFGELADTIVFGADVSHAGSSMPFTPSVAAVVASEDKDFAHFSASMRLQASTQEMIEDLEDMVYCRLKRFLSVRKAMPQRILFFRDGVSEDQFADCRNTEIPRIYSACRRVQRASGGKMTEVSLTFVVVGKRHHTRFFATRENQTWDDSKGLPNWSGATKTIPNRSGPSPTRTVPVTLNGNVKAGLLVDQVITRPDVDTTVDFFLQSHAALQGTSRSGHYSVLQTNGFTLDQIKELTHAFCYNYMRATKGVSYVGPAYYADRLCERGTVYLKAYTNGATAPPCDPSEEQKKSKGGMTAYAQKVAEKVAGDLVWRTDRRNPGSEPNPWHPNFDNTMFWL